ncbi:uncharacterized protein LOC128200157 [Galleria mellonella]|uniref:Uncharacterized protein LOC128200157 n=1 Tax=Galleria mellonella TaxID=7137 RepID=A0ABM3MB21_GALME|nr:uncharacterized protein LOC128200157 [Galleria mellonella]
MVISGVESEAIQDTGSDDDVIEVVRDEAPIEILSDGEEFGLESNKETQLATFNDSFHFTSVPSIVDVHSEYNADTKETVEDPLDNNATSSNGQANSIDEPLTQIPAVSEITQETTSDCTNTDQPTTNQNNKQDDSLIVPDNLATNDSATVEDNTKLATQENVTIDKSIILEAANDDGSDTKN